MLAEYIFGQIPQLTPAQSNGKSRPVSSASSSGQNSGSSTTSPAATVAISPSALAKSRASNATSSQGKTLSADQQKEVEELKKRDTDVHAHEQAHLAAAGSYARGGASYDYQTGPDGKQYAIGGEVGIDTSKEKDPHETLKKAQIVQAAALAPADPSGQDQSVAAQAVQMAAEAQQEIDQQANSASKTSTGSSSATESKPQQQDANSTNANGVESASEQSGLSAAKIPSSYTKQSSTTTSAASARYSWVA